MDKKATDKEIQKMWDENVGKIAFDLEDAMLQVFSQNPAAEKPAILLGSISIAAAHFIQVMEKQIGYHIDLKEPFIDVLQQAYVFYREHPSDEEPSPSFPVIKTPFMA